MCTVDPSVLIIIVRPCSEERVGLFIFSTIGSLYFVCVCLGPMRCYVNMHCQGGGSNARLGGGGGGGGREGEN